MTFKETSNSPRGGNSSICSDMYINVNIFYVSILILLQYLLYGFFLFYRNVGTASENVKTSFETAAPVTTSDTHKKETGRHGTLWEMQNNSISNAASTISSQVRETVPTSISIPLLRNTSLERFVPNYETQNSTNL